VRKGCFWRPSQCTAQIRACAARAHALTKAGADRRHQPGTWPSTQLAVHQAECVRTPVSEDDLPCLGGPASARRPTGARLAGFPRTRQADRRQAHRQRASFPVERPGASNPTRPSCKQPLAVTAASGHSRVGAQLARACGEYRSAQKRLRTACTGAASRQRARIARGRGGCRIA